jgi:hypothetical protein
MNDMIAHLLHCLTRHDRPSDHELCHAKEERHLNRGSVPQEGQGMGASSLCRPVACELACPRRQEVLFGVVSIDHERIS